MAASILGKRSRQVLESEDFNVVHPRPKRRTRQNAPAIFEDEQDQCISVNASAESEPCDRESTHRPSTRSRRRQNEPSLNEAKTKPTVIKRQTKRQLQSAEELVDSENIPPVVIATPTTTRFQDCLVQNPQHTPKHRVKVTGSLLTPKSSGKRQSSSLTHNVFSQARQLFTQSSNSSKLVGRESERQQIRQFITQAVDTQKGGCAYVSGPPGTGKSAHVQDVLSEFENSEAVEITIINCVALRTTNDIFTKLLQSFAPNRAVEKSDVKKHLSKLFLTKTKQRLRLILLDEIDNLIDAECDVLYTLFEWALHKNSSMVLIGIANALDLTDRFLPRLKTKGCKPNVLPFHPYNASQISAIISEKLRSLLPETSSVSQDFVPFMQPVAVQLCGKKIASQSGDLRKAFSLVRRIIDQVELETQHKQGETSPSKKPLGEIHNAKVQQLFSPAHVAKQETGPTISYSIETAPRATIAHVARMASTIFSNGTLSRLTGLNLQQKAVLCSLVAGEKRKQERNPFVTPSKSTNKVPTIKDLFFKYTTLCRRDEGLLQPLQDTEFRDVVASLETLGLVQEYKGRASSLLTPSSTPSRAGRNIDEKQIVSAVSEKEMRESLSGAGADLLRRLLDEN